MADTVSLGGKRIEINTIQAVKNSANKLLMKQCFDNESIKTAEWFTFDNLPEELKFPLVAKHHNGSRGTGNYLLKSLEEFNSFKESGRDLTKYILERYKAFSLEFRLHVTKNGCFYTCRKALKKDTPEDRKWCMNDETCVWFVEENPQFLRPNSWEDIENECVEALLAIGADVLAMDVRVQSATDKKGNPREYQDYVIIECNSGPSMGEITLERYLHELPILLTQKAKESNII